jgi:hypothetical protein
MNCLKIDNNEGFFSVNGSDFTSIVEIKKEDVLKLLDIALDPDEEFEMDEYDAELLPNAAHRVIYENLYNKFSEIKTNKEQFTNEANELYQDVYDKYKLSEDAEES